MKSNTDMNSRIKDKNLNKIMIIIAIVLGSTPIAACFIIFILNASIYITGENYTAKCVDIQEYTRYDYKKHNSVHRYVYKFEVEYPDEVKGETFTKQFKGKYEYKVGDHVNGKYKEAKPKLFKKTMYNFTIS